MPTQRGSIVAAAVDALNNASAFGVNGARELTDVFPNWSILTDGPAVFVSDPESTQPVSAYGKHTHPLTLRVEVIGTKGTPNETMRGFAQAVLTALSGDSTLSGLLEQMDLNSVRLNPGGEEDTIATIVVELTAIYEADIWVL